MRHDRMSIARCVVALPLGLAALAGVCCATAGGGRDWAAGWRSLLAIRGAQLGEPVELPRAPYADAVFAGALANPRLSEASGLAPSRRASDLLWALNDSGKKPRLYAVGVDGSDRGFVLLEDAAAVDWEDLASFRRAGRSYLVVADTGDNWSWRRSVELLVVPEPELAGERLAPGGTARVAWRIPFRFEDGPRDCEALAVDPAEPPRALLHSQRTEPPVLYELPLLPAAGSAEAGGGAALRTARRLGEVPGIPPPTRADVAEARWLGRYRAMPTGLDISPDGRFAAVITYRDAYLFTRRAGESWAATFARAPQRIPLPPMRQAEAIAFGADGRTLFATGERRPAPLFRFDWWGGPLSSRGERSRSLR